MTINSGFPIKNGDFQIFSIAMLNYQRVDTKTGLSDLVLHWSRSLGCLRIAGQVLQRQSCHMQPWVRVPQFAPADSTQRDLYNNILYIYIILYIYYMLYIIYNIYIYICFDGSNEKNDQE